MSVQYAMTTPWGWTQQVLSFDIPGLEAAPDKTAAVLWNYWQGLAATAATRNASLIYITYVQWKSSPAPNIYAGLQLSGLHFGPAAARDRSGVLLLHSGHDDKNACRRFFVPSMPVSWQDGELLTDAGWDGLMALAHGWAMGVLSNYCGGEAQLLHAYPRILPIVPENLGGVAFRRVVSLRVLQYVGKAPDWSSEMWP